MAARGDRTLPPALPPADPAVELRRKLAESRAADAPAEPTRPSERNESLEQRRAHVHAKAQEVLSAMDEIEGPT